MIEMTPREIAQALDQHIIGQDHAKHLVAIALRNRWRRMQLPEALRQEITPKNILMIGPTGVGKTEIARRLAKLAKAPFIKVEATKFTEIGYVGREVDSIIRDLMDVAVKMLRENALMQVRLQAEAAAKERILDVLLPHPRTNEFLATANGSTSSSQTRQKFKEKLQRGELDDKEVDIEISASPVGVEIMTPPGMEEMASQLQNMFANVGGQKKQTRRMTVKNALRQITEEEAHLLISED